MDGLLTIEELGQELKVPVATIYRWNSLGSGPRYIKVGRAVRYRRLDVDNWLRGREVNVRPPAA